MSTKINIRSPFLLNITEPVIPLPTFSCDTAALTGFAVDNQGVITNPTPAYGIIDSISSSDSGFSNNKYATVSSDTTRTITVRVRIPFGYTNTASVFFDCQSQTTQAGLTASNVQTPCTVTVTTQGSISAQTIAVGGTSVDIALAGFFNNETVYAVTNGYGTLITTALSGSTLTIAPNAIGGSGTIYVEGRDGNYPTTCAAVQSIAVTVNGAASPPTFSCTTANLNGGSVSTAGVITNPSTTAVITGISLTNGGSLITSVPANSGSTAQNVTLFFKLTVPAGYSNAGATLYCSKVFSQDGTSPPTFTCSIAALTQQSISKNGSIFIGSAAVGTVKSFTTPDWLGTTVSSNTPRDIVFQVLIPSGYANANGSNTIDCTRTLTQPATLATVAGANTYFISGRVLDLDSLCDATLATTQAVTSSGASITGLMGTTIFRNGTPYNGKTFYFGVQEKSMSSGAGIGVGDFYAIQIDASGLVLDVVLWTCDGGGLGKGGIL